MSITHFGELHRQLANVLQAEEDFRFLMGEPGGVVAEDEWHRRHDEHLALARERGAQAALVKMLAPQ